MAVVWWCAASSAGPEEWTGCTNHSGKCSEDPLQDHLKMYVHDTKIGGTNKYNLLLYYTTHSMVM